MTADVPAEAETPRVDLDRAEQLAAAATPGPWKLWGMDVLADPVGDSNLDTALPIARTSEPHRGLRTFNASFIAEARTLVPALVAELRQVRDENERLTAELQGRSDSRRTRGRCMDRSPVLTAAGRRESCVLLYGHSGAHEGPVEVLGGFGPMPPVQWIDNAATADVAARLAAAEAEVSRLRAAVEVAHELTEKALPLGWEGDADREASDALDAAHDVLAAALSVGDTNPEADQ